MDYLLRDTSICNSLKVQPRDVWDLHKEYFVVPVASGLLTHHQLRMLALFLLMYLYINRHTVLYLGVHLQRMCICFECQNCV